MSTESPTSGFLRAGLVVIAIGLMTALASSGCAVLNSNKTAEDEADNDQAVRPYVATICLQQETESQVDRTFTGTVTAREVSDLGFRSIGQIETIDVDNGDRVRAGQVLAVLDSASLKAQRDVLKAQKETAQALLDELIAGPRQQTVDAARAQLAEAQAVRDQMQRDWQRYQSIAHTNAVSRQAVDAARQQMIAAESRRVAQAQVVAELEAGTRKEQLAAQQGEVARLDASLRLLEVQLRENQIIAPFDGVVSRRFLDPGAVVQPGVPVLRLMDTSPLEVWVGLPPDMIDRLEVGSRYTFSTSRGPRTGILSSILSELNAQTRTQTVIFELTPDTNIIPLAVGQIVQLQLSQTIPTDGFWIPLHALVRGARGLWSVFVVIPEDNGDGYLVRRSDVEAIRVESSRILVTGAIREGDLIVKSGVQKLTSGQRVQLKPDTTTEDENH